LGIPFLAHDKLKQLAIELTTNISNFLKTGELYAFTNNEVRKIIEEHKNDKKWFDYMHISPIFKNLPNIYTWKGKPIEVVT
jgi:hypothetical protein